MGRLWSLSSRLVRLCSRGGPLRLEWKWCVVWLVGWKVHWRCKALRGDVNDTNP